MSGPAPVALIPGERLLWQGRPCAWGLAWRAFHVRELPLYFGAFLIWRLAALLAAKAPAAAYISAVLWIVAPMTVSVALLTALAWLFARASRYTLTSRRVLLQFGVALPVTMTIPLGRIGAAALRLYGDGSGDIPLRITGERVSHLLLWPHVRPWRLVQSEPMLRAVPRAAMVAALLSEALGGLPVPASAGVPAPDLTGSVAAA